MNKTSPVIRLPNELIWEYMFHLDPPTLAAACRVSRVYYQVCNNDQFFKDKLKFQLGITWIPSQFRAKTGDPMPYKSAYINIYSLIAVDFIVNVYPDYDTFMEDEDYNPTSELTETEKTELFNHVSEYLPVVKMDLNDSLLYLATEGKDQENSTFEQYMNFISERDQRTHLEFKNGRMAELNVPPMTDFYYTIGYGGLPI